MATRKKGPRKGTRPRKADRSGDRSGKNRSPGARGKRQARLPSSPSSETSAASDATEPAGGRRPVPFPVVGVGGSAGALAPLQELLRGLPSDAGLAVVIVSHQAPHAASMLREILSRCTEMPVVNVTGKISIAPNRVYVAPPGRLLDIRDGFLVAGKEIERGHLPLPIDTFFRALAADRGHAAVGVLLSGTGTDGSLGLAAIRAATGLALVQEPMSAEFGGMPSSAIDALAVDLVLPVAEMPAHLADYAKAIAHSKPSELAGPASTDLEQIISMIRARTGRDFSAYKPGTLQRRIRRRMDLRGIRSLHDYARFLDEDPDELDALWRDWLIGVSGFFRDPEAFKLLGDVALPRLLLSRTDKEPLRIWIPGCATGEEAYTIAMVVLETLEHIGRAREVQIFATDLDPAAIQVARTGRYPEGIGADLTPDRLQRFFTREERHLRVKPVLRDMIVFAVQNLLQDPPFTRMDLISCRNLLMYLTAPAQRSLVPLFFYSLRPGGLLMLGSSEALAGSDEAFSVVDKRWKIFRRGDSVPDALPVVWAERTRAHGDPTRARGLPSVVQPPDLPDIMRQRLVAQFAPPSVLVDAQGRIHQVHGNVAPFLGIAPGRASLNAIEMAREGLRAPLVSALRQVQVKNREATEKMAQVKMNRRWRHIRLRAEKIGEPLLDRSMVLVSFELIPEVPRATKGAGRGAAAGEGREELAQVRRELLSTQDALHGTIEELQGSNEALASANEEVQSMNEELQSSNEELQTSKEETQSLNEELQTLNEDLTRKVELLEQANDDLQNVINTTRIATIILDEHLRVKRFTGAARALIRLVDSDVGRNLTDLATTLEYPDLIEDAERVLNDLEAMGREVRGVDGTWYHVSISPYRDSRGVIQGLILAFSDISQLKHAEQETQVALELADAIVATVREPLLVLDGSLRVTRTNRAFDDTFQVDAREVVGQLVYDLGERQWNIPALRELLERILPEDASFEGFQVSTDFPRIGRRTFVLNARRIRGAEDLTPQRILLAFQELREASRGPAA